MSSVAGFGFGGGCDLMLPADPHLGNFHSEASNHEEGGKKDIAPMRARASISPFSNQGPSLARSRDGNNKGVRPSSVLSLYPFSATPQIGTWASEPG